MLLLRVCKFCCASCSLHQETTCLFKRCTFIPNCSFVRGKSGGFKFKSYSSNTRLSVRTSITPCLNTLCTLYTLFLQQEPAQRKGSHLQPKIGWVSTARRRKAAARTIPGPPKCTLVSRRSGVGGLTAVRRPGSPGVVGRVFDRRSRGLVRSQRNTAFRSPEGCRLRVVALV